MRLKLKSKRFWIFLIIWAIIFLYIRITKQFHSYNKHNVTPIEKLQQQKTTNSEHISVSEVIDVNKFIKAAAAVPITNFYAYNHRLSDKIGAYRALPDTRDEACKARNYYLPQHQRLKVSVIIAFHNEARSTLMRTIMSVYRRTPAKYLHELILVDDNSMDAMLLSTLRHLTIPPFVQNFYYSNDMQRNLRSKIKVEDVTNADITNNFNATVSSADDNGDVVIKMQRNSRRLGLIESRNIGARLASGDYLLFLDSHCEVNVGWLEPMLERVTHVSYTGAVGAKIIAVSPVLDSINAKTLQYRASSQQLMGGFDWNLHFHWMRRERFRNATKLIEDYSQTHFKSPVTAGGVFLISRIGFHNLKGFNPSLQIWGGESIEFSIKLWLCGGQIEIVPCSRVGHIFWKQHTFQFANSDNGQATYLRNSKIIAETWLDNYKYFFYALKPAAKNIKINISNTELEEFKRKRLCRPFAWYLSNVFPQLKLPNDDFIAFGKLSTAESCLHILKPHEVLLNQKSPISSSQEYSTMTKPHVRLQMANCYHTDVTRWYLHRHNAHLHSGSGACLNVIRTSMSSTPYSMPFLSLSLSLSVPSSKFLNQTLDMDAVAEKHFIVVLQYCRQTAKSQRWLRRRAQLIHEQTHLCLDNPLNDVVAVSHCRHEAPSQLFHFTMEMQQL